VRRRAFLRTAAAVAGCGAAAGCSRLTAEEPTVPGEEFPVVDEWLTETEVGGADDTYGGTLLDRRERDEVRVDVGADGNGGTFAYAPSALVVSPGTTVRWAWVDDREGHSVVADPERQLGESDYAFASEGVVAEEGHEFVHTLDREGIALYHCTGIAQSHWESRGAAMSASSLRDPNPHLEPHRLLGMKGGIAVSE
jgi:halocyanin-like protein